MVNEVIYDLQVFNIEGPSTCYVNVKGQVLPRIGDTYRIGEDRNRKPYVVTDVIHRTNILEDRVKEESLTANFLNPIVVLGRK